MTVTAQQAEAVIVMAAQAADAPYVDGTYQLLTPAERRARDEARNRAGVSLTFARVDYKCSRYRDAAHYAMLSLAHSAGRASTAYGEAYKLVGEDL